MPVEIRELQITTVVQDNASSSSGSAAQSTNSSANTEAIVAACVEQVMEILKQKNER